MIRPFRSAARAVLISSALVLSACGEDSSPNETGSSGPVSFANAASEQQQAALSDGEVTFAEYEAGVLAFVECANQLGIDVLDLRYDEVTDQFDYFAVPGPDRPADDAEGLGRDHDTCYAEHFEGLQQAWTLASLAPLEEFEAVRPIVEACIEPFDIEVPSDAPPQQIGLMILDSGVGEAFACLTHLEPWN